MYSDKPRESKNSKEKLKTDCYAMVNLKIQAKFLSSPKPYQKTKGQVLCLNPVVHVLISVPSGPSLLAYFSIQ